MRIDGERLAANLERELQAVYAVYGEEPLLVLEAADAIRAAARRRGFDEREVLTVLTGFNWNELAHAGASLSLFGSRKLIDLRLPSGKPGRDGSAALQEYCVRRPPDTLLLITLGEVEWREEKAAWLNAVATAGVVVKTMPPTLAELPAWISARLARQKQSTTGEGLRFIAEHVEGNLLAAHQEVVKLAVLYPPGALDPEQLRQALHDVARYDLDTLREAMLTGNVARLARALDGLQQEGEAPPLVLWAMSEEVRALVQIHRGLAAGQALDAMFESARVWGPRRAQFEHALRRTDGKRAQAALTQAATIDRMVKGLLAGDVWNEFRRLGLRIAAPR